MEDIPYLNGYGLERIVNNLQLFSNFWEWVTRHRTSGVNVQLVNPTSLICPHEHNIVRAHASKLFSTIKANH